MKMGVREKNAFIAKMGSCENALVLQKEMFIASFPGTIFIARLLAYSATLIANLPSRKG